MIGFIYVLSNEAMPGLVKIGLTVDTPESRAKSLFSSGVPLPFRVEFYASVNDCLKVERAIHEDMARFRLHDGREFFTVSVDEAIQAVTRQVDLFNAEASLSFIETPKSLHDLLRERVLQSENRSEVARQAGITYPALRSFLSGSDVKSSTFRRIANAVGLKLVLRKVGSMAAPIRSIHSRFRNRTWLLVIHRPRGDCR